MAADCGKRILNELPGKGWPRRMVSTLPSRESQKAVGEAYIFAQCSGGNSGGHDLMIPGAILRGGTSFGSEGTQ